MGAVTDRVRHRLSGANPSTHHRPGQVRLGAPSLSCPGIGSSSDRTPPPIIRGAAGALRRQQSRQHPDHRWRRHPPGPAHRRRREPRRNGAWYRIVLHHPSRLPGDASLRSASQPPRGVGELLRVGVESTGTYGAGIKAGTWHSRVSPCDELPVRTQPGRRAKVQGRSCPGCDFRGRGGTRIKTSGVQAGQRDRSGSVEALRVLRTIAKPPDNLVSPWLPWSMSEERRRELMAPA